VETVSKLDTVSTRTGADAKRRRILAELNVERAAQIVERAAPEPKQITYGAAMALFKRKSQMEKFQTTLAQYQLRAAALADKHAAAKAALAEAMTARERHHLEGDIADEVTAGKLQAKVDSCNSTLAGLDAAITTLGAQIADVERQLTAERERVERAAAAKMLTENVAAFEAVLPKYLEQSRAMVDALSGFAHMHFESDQMAKFIQNVNGQIEVAAAFAVTELRSTANAIANGAAPIPKPKQAPAPIAVAEPSPPTRTLWCLKSIKWREDGRQRAVLQFEDAELPVHLAERALRHGACVEVTDERRKNLKNSRGGEHPNLNSRDIIDLDAADDFSPVKFAVPGADPQLPPGFTRLERGEARTITHYEPRIG
jgi:hypothetical protein